MRGKALQVEERDEILRGICEGASDRLIASRLGRHQSVVSREISRNGGRAPYRVHAAPERYEQPKRRRRSARSRFIDGCMTRSRRA